MVFGQLQPDVLIHMLARSEPAQPASSLLDMHAVCSFCRDPAVLRMVGSSSTFMAQITELAAILALRVVRSTAPEQRPIRQLARHLASMFEARQSLLAAGFSHSVCPCSRLSMRGADSGAGLSIVGRTPGIR